MPRGISIDTAFQNHLISIENIISGMQSAVSYLQHLNIAHNDLKISNIVYHDGVVKLIDFGTAQTNIQNPDHYQFEFNNLIWVYRELFGFEPTNIPAELIFYPRKSKRQIVSAGYILLTQFYKLNRLSKFIISQNNFFKMQS